MNEDMLGIYSGECFEGFIGEAIERKDICGRDLFVGDIVMVWHGRHLGTDEEVWLPDGGLTAVVKDEDGNYVMGIKNCFIEENKHWKVCIVKSYKDVIADEHWSEFGFSYRKAKEMSEERKDCTQNDLVIDGLRISTWYSKGVDHPYKAIDMTHAAEYIDLTEEEKTSMTQLTGAYARLLDDYGLTGYGNTECEAISDLIDNFRIYLTRDRVRL